MKQSTDSNEGKIRESINKDIKCHLKRSIVDSYDEMIAELQEMKRKLIEENKV